jgi:hypothetical protein
MKRKAANTTAIVEEFYDLQADPQESTNILLRTLTSTEQLNLDNLRIRLGQLSD